MVIEEVAIGATRDMVALGVVGHTANRSMKMAGYRPVRRRRRKARKRRIKRRRR